MRHLLIVEDSPSVRGFIRSAAEEPDSGLGDVEIAEAASGFDALRLLPRGRFDVVITDVNMPDVNGLELVSFMRRSEAHRLTPIMVISTQSASRDRERIMALGANCYLVKPFTKQQLLAELLGLIGVGRDEAHG